jgi:hypothetical protein
VTEGESAVAKHIEDVFEEKARAGDGQFAMAYALLKLAQNHERLATKVGYLGFDAPGSHPAPGALEFIGMQMRDLVEVMQTLNITASIENSNA